MRKIYRKLTKEQKGAAGHPASKQIEESIDLEAAPEYIWMKTERDVYKEMYMNLLQMKAAM